MSIKDYPLLIITARIGSRRLPGKVLRNIWRDCSILEFIIRRFQRVPEMSRLCLATADSKENDVVAQVGERYGLCVVRGVENDVVGRMAQCLQGQDVSHVGRITADNPLTDPRLLLQQWKAMVKRRADYAYCRVVPPGIAADLWTRECFDKTVRYASGTYEREHANAHVWNKEQQYRVFWYDPKGVTPPDKNIPLTVDTMEDFTALNRWVNTLNDPLAYEILS